jgi:hypothetical protein
MLGNGHDFTIPPAYPRSPENTNTRSIRVGGGT